MSDVLERLRASDPATDERGWSSSPAGESVRERIAPAPRGRRSWVVAVAAAVVVLALVIGVAVVTTATDTSPTKPVSAIQRLVHGKWHRLPKSPLGAVVTDAQLFSTRRGILLWDGSKGAHFETSTGRWHRIPDPPVALTAQLSVWTGRDLVFPVASLAYNLRTDHWQSIRQAPVSFTGGALVLWAPPHVMVVQPACPLCQTFLMTDGRAGSAEYDPSTDTWTEIQSPPQAIVNYAIGWSGRWTAVWGKSTVDPSSSMEMLGADGSWQTAIGYSKSTSSAAASLVRVGHSLVWVHWDDRAAAVEWQRSWSPELVDVGRPLPYRDICAVEASPGPQGSVVVQCNRGDRLRLLDTARDRWLDLSPQPKPIVTSVWNGRDLYALGVGGGLFTLR